MSCQFYLMAINTPESTPLQAPILVCEAVLADTWCRARLPRVPYMLRVILTNAALIAVAGPLFFGPADDTGFTTRNVDALRPFMLWIGQACRSASEVLVGRLSSIQQQ